jgi:hypothetical protein
LYLYELISKCNKIATHAENERRLRLPRMPNDSLPKSFRIIRLNGIHIFC